MRGGGGGKSSVSHSAELREGKPRGNISLGRAGVAAGCTGVSLGCVGVRAGSSAGVPPSDIDSSELESDEELREL